MATPTPPTPPTPCPDEVLAYLSAIRLWGMVQEDIN